MIGSMAELESFWDDKNPYLRSLAIAMTKKEPWCIDAKISDRLVELIEQIQSAKSVSEISEPEFLELLGYVSSINAIPLLGQIEKVIDSFTERLVVFGDGGASHLLFVERLLVVRSAGLLVQLYSSERASRIIDFLTK